MKINELLEKEFYIVDCMDFTYFARPVHIIGIGVTSVDEEFSYMIDVKDFINPNEYRTMYMYELEKFKTMEDAEKEAKRLNNIPFNKKIAKEWNTKGKFMCEIAKQYLN